MDMLDFTELGKNKPKILARFNLPSDKMRIYVHGERFAFGSPYNARDHVLKTFNDLRLKEKSDYFIILPWIDEENRMVDFFGYNWEEPWPVNSECPSPIYTRNGKIFAGKCCTDARLICGAEEFYRRLTKTFEGYLNNPPRIKGLEFQPDSDSYH